MSLFTSNRERSLWFWTLTVMVAIYSTLSQVRVLTGVLRDRDLLTPGFFIGLFLVGAAILLQGLKTRPGGAEIGVALGIAGVYLLAFLRMVIAEERGHLIEYSVVALLIHAALMERARNGRSVPRPAALAVIVTALLGWLDEGIQAILPNRIYDIRDVGFNALAALVAITASLALGWARRRRGYILSIAAHHQIKIPQ